MINKTCIVLVFFLLTACAATKGPEPIISEKGPINKNAKTGSAAKFVSSHFASWTSPGDSLLANQMATDGFTLVFANCSDFFLSAGETQKWLIVVRDTVGAVGTVAAGVIALHNGNPTVAGGIALGTSTAFSGLDIYTKNFLFAAENISAVRTLTTNALNVHRGAVLNSGQLTYNSASEAIFDHQEICSPMAIAALARDAIQKGTVVASQDPSIPLNNVADIQDDQVLQSLGVLLKPVGPIAMDQAGALWWLLMEPTSDDEIKNYIAPKLKGLADQVNPFDSNGNLKAGYQVDNISEQLKKFSPATKSALRSSIAATRIAIAKREKEIMDANEKSKAAGVPLAPAGVNLIPMPPSPIFTKATLERSQSFHFSVGIK